MDRSNYLFALLRIVSARAAFLHFLRTEYQSETTALQEFLARFDSEDKPLTDAVDHAQILIDTYNPDGNFKEEIQQESLWRSILKGRSVAQGDPNRAYKQNLLTVSNEALTLMILAAFPYFVGSQAYQEWCESVLGADTSYEGREDRLDALFSFREGASEETVNEAVASVDAREIDRLLATGAWLDSFFAAVEDLPVCVSLATANVNRKGFPLIYVNKAFEQTTGYSRSEIVGQNCRFLQSGGFCEQEIINKMTHALATASPIKVAITNYRKDGTTFKNLLAMKPIFDTKGTYRFVIGVQFDVTAEDADISKINMIDDLLSILPNVVFCEDEV